MAKVVGSRPARDNGCIVTTNGSTSGPEGRCERLVSLQAYAKLSGLNVSTVSRQVRDGIIPTHQVGRRKLIDPVEAEEARRTKLDHTLNKGQAVPISDVRARRLAAQAELAELELAREKGRLLDVELVEKAVSEAVGVTKNRLCAIPERMGPVLAAESPRSPTSS